MKIYLIEHPELGYLAGNSNSAKYFTKSIEFGRKFNRRSDVSNCLNTTLYIYNLPEEWPVVQRECKVVCYTLEIINKDEF